MNEWWGYKHTNGTINVKRFWDYQDIDEARESDFVVRVSAVFNARSREEALSICCRVLNL